MNIGKAFKLAMMPIAAILLLAVLNGVSSLFGVIPGINICMGIIQCLFFPLILLLNVVLFVYAGYLIAKGGMEIIDAAVVGGITGVLTLVVTAIFSIIATIITTTFNLASNTISNNNNLTSIGTVVLGGGIGVLTQLFCFAGYAITAGIIGAILAVIGALIAGTKK